MAGLVFKNLKSLGGIDAAEALNRTKAKRLYDCIDASRMFTAPVAPDDRSRMNVIFKTGDSDIDRQFVEGAEARGLTGLAGHRLAGGMRASLYNAVTAEAVEALVRYIEEFDKLHAGGSHVPHQNL
jgi:phosphoserine aminotransferase